MFVVNFLFMLSGYVVSYQNQLTKCFELKFGWSDDEKAWKNSILGAVAIIGMTAGCLSGGTLMKIGRRLSLIIAVFIGMVGVGLTAAVFSLNFPLLLIGRTIFGISCGIIASIVPKFIEETVPAHVWGSMGVILQTASAVGTLISYLLAEVLPEDTDEKDLKATVNWIYPYLVFPAGVQVMALLFFLTVLREDSIKYLILSGKTE